MRHGIGKNLSCKVLPFCFKFQAVWIVFENLILDERKIRISSDDIRKSGFMYPFPLLVIEKWIIHVKEPIATTQSVKLVVKQIMHSFTKDGSWIKGLGHLAYPSIDVVYILVYFFER